MDLAWVSDKWRRKGVMTRRWLGWRKSYGDFTLSPPWSSTMRAFVIKMNVALDGAVSPTDDIGGGIKSTEPVSHVEEITGTRGFHRA